MATNKIVYYDVLSGKRYSTIPKGFVKYSELSKKEQNAIQEKYRKDNPIVLDEVTIYSGGEPVVNPSETEANLKHRAAVKQADALTKETAAFEKVLNFASPGQWVGAGIDALQGQTPFWLGLLNGNSGWVPDLLAQNYPITSNIVNFIGDIAIPYAGAKFYKWGTTPRLIGQGAEAVVRSAPLSTQVTKVTTIPRAEMHARNMVPGALKSRYVKTSNGLTTYTQPKVRILSKERLAKANKALERIMSGTKWKKITHPNMEGIGFTDGNWVVSDIGPGNIGRDWLGRLRLVDFSMEPMPAFKLAMQKRGGRLINNN